MCCPPYSLQCLPQPARLPHDARRTKELITRIGPGTACGDLLRRYWQAVALVDEFGARLDPAMALRPITPVRLLGQDLVLFRGCQNRFGLLEGSPPEDWHGEPRSNDTHESPSAPESRLYRKSNAAPALPCYLGHVQTENRHGLVGNVQASRAPPNSDGKIRIYRWFFNGLF